MYKHSTGTYDADGDLMAPVRLSTVVALNSPKSNASADTGGVVFRPGTPSGDGVGAPGSD
jgi:hypothetical protein